MSKITYITTYLPHELYSNREPISAPVEAKDYVNPVKQEFADEADINYLIKKFSLGQVVEESQRAAAEFADVTSVGSLFEAFERVGQAMDAFDALPAELRAKYDNDPVKLAQWYKEPQNEDEAISLGFLKPKQVKVEPVKVEPAKPETKSEGVN